MTREGNIFCFSKGTSARPTVQHKTLKELYFRFQEIPIHARNSTPSFTTIKYVTTTDFRCFRVSSSTSTKKSRGIRRSQPLKLIRAVPPRASYYSSRVKNSFSLFSVSGFRAPWRDKCASLSLSLSLSLYQRRRKLALRCRCIHPIVETRA